MKIKKEHFEHLKIVIEAYLDKNPKLVSDYESGRFHNSDKTNNLQMRFCFDVQYFSGLVPYICKHIYKYANDDHLFTALKRICPKVEKKY